MRIYLLFICASLIGLMGCTSATGTKFSQLQQPEPGRSLVYLYRPNQFENRSHFPLIYLDDKPTKNLRNGGYLVLDVPPGDYNLSTNDDGDPEVSAQSPEYPHDGPELSTVFQRAKHLSSNPFSFKVTEGETLFIAMVTRYQAGNIHYTGGGIYFYHEPGVGTARFIEAPEELALNDLYGLRESD